MYYQTQLLAIDDANGLLLAIHHYPHVIGGEDTRETAYAGFASGRASAPGDRIDHSAACLPPRPASPAQAKALERIAKGQGEFARTHTGSMVEQYAANELAYRHAAELARQTSVRVPRRVFAARSGHALLAYDPSRAQAGGESLPGMLRRIDLRQSRIDGEWSSSRAPLDRPGRGVRRYSSVHLARPLGLSADGQRVILVDPSDPNRILLVECRLDDELGELGQRRWTHNERVIGYSEGWISRAENRLLWLAPGLAEVLAECPMPRGTSDWNMAATPDGRWVALSGTGGDVFLLARDGGKARRFSPHRGARRDQAAQPSLSSCGRWMVSRCGSQVVLTRLEDGLSWPLATLEDAVLHDASVGGYQIRSHLPAAVAFIGQRLLAVDRGQVTELGLTGSDGAFVSEHGRPGARKPIRVRRTAPLAAQLRAAQLEGHAEALKALYSPAVQLKSKALKQAGWRLPGGRAAAPLGTSRIGGWPDLPEDQPWPRWQDRPMAFLAQLNLTEAHAAQPALRLPSNGLLSFFLGCTDQSYCPEDDPRPRYLMDLMVGTEATSGDAWRVLYHPDTDRLERRICTESPLPELVQPCALRMQAAGLALPNEDCVAYERLVAKMSPIEHENYNELLGQLRFEDDEATEQMMGYPQLIQGTPPELMCELAARGMNPWTLPEPNSVSHAELNAAAGEWALLLQLTSNPPADLCWGDGGHFYFYGRREAMAQGDFSRVWVNFET